MSATVINSLEFVKRRFAQPSYRRCLNNAKPATVIILPILRVERYDYKPPTRRAKEKPHGR